jgi:hypothetical protein
MRNKILLLFFLASTYSISIAQTIAITEIMYNADSSLQSKSWVELYNYGTASVNLSDWVLKDETVVNTFVIPVGTNIGAGDYLVIAQSLDTFALIYPTVTNVIGSFAFGFDNTSGSVRIYNASGALVKSVSYIDSLPWPNAADGLGPSLQIEDYTADANDPDNWFAGCVGGSPGTAYQDCAYDIVVSEINYHSADVFDMKNWIEIWNTTSGAINIGNWIFRDNNRNNSFTIPAGTMLSANGRLVICDSLPAMNSLWPSVTNIIGEFDFGLSNNGDGVRLYDNSGKLRYSVRYDDALPWPEDADGAGYTLEWVESAGNPNLYSSWFAGCPYGSPGAAFSLPCGTTIINAIVSETYVVYPNPYHETVNISLANGITGSQTECRITDIHGRIIFSSTFYDSLQWNGKDADQHPVPPGIYVVKILKNGIEVSSQKLMRG